MSLLLEIIGQAGVDALAPDFGGRSLRVPTMANHPRSIAVRIKLIALLGPTLASDLITVMGNTRVYIPIGPTDARPTVSNRDVGRLSRQGKSAKAIAAKLGCSERTVFNKRRKIAANLARKAGK